MTTPEAATEHEAREAMAGVARSLDPAGLNTGRAGNLSLRWHRGARAGMLITPSAVPYEAMCADDLVWMPLHQADREEPEQFGSRPASSEWRMHLALQCRHGTPDPAVLHVHSRFASTLACLPRIQREGIPAFHYMIAVAGGNDIRCAPYATFGSPELAALLPAALEGRSACLLANHGLLVTGASLAAALERAREVEWLARVYWQALQIGEPVVLDDAQMAAVHERFAASAYRSA